MVSKPATSALTFTNVTKEYKTGHNSVRAVDAVSLQIPAGKLTVILGPSGSGKSTMLNMIGGMDTASSGTIQVFDDTISDYSAKKLTKYRRKDIGFVFQFYNLIGSLNAFENVDIARKLGDNPLNSHEMIEAVGLKERAKHFPAELSGGELQRLSIARALAKNPSLLLCDEPTGALDSETGKQVLRLLQQMACSYQKTVIIVTHNATLASCADYVVHLKDGKVTKTVTNTHPLAIDKVAW